MPSAKSLFTKGVSAFQAGTYQDALDFFTEALGQDIQQQQSQLHYSIYDSRAAAYEKLNRLNDALRDCKSAMELAPTRWQAYARAARLLLQTQRFDTAIKMADRALARLSADSANGGKAGRENDASPGPLQQRRSELESIKVSALRNLDSNKVKVPVSDGKTKKKKRKTGNNEESQPPCYISSLPTELLTEIFSLVIAQDHSALARIIIRVCRRWQSIAWDCPALWGILVIGYRSSSSRHGPEKKANTWISRSRGNIYDLRVDHRAILDVDRRISFEKELGSLRWDGLRALSILQWDVISYLKSISLMGALGSLEKLETGGNLRLNALLSAAHNLTEISLDGARFNIESITSRTLRHVFMKGCDYGDHSFKLFEQQPLLKTLIVVDEPINTRQWNPLAGVINLNYLTHIDIDLCSHVPLERLMIPNLRTLRISRTGTVLNDCFSHLATLNLPNFEELVISHAFCGARALIGFLKTVPTLTCLALKGYRGLASEVIEALAKPLEGPQTNPICPSLQHVNVSQSPDIKTASLVRLVKSRLHDGHEGHTVVPIQSLIMDACPGIESDILPWFRQRVPTVSCIYLSKNAAGWKR